MGKGPVKVGKVVCRGATGDRALVPRGFAEPYTNEGLIFSKTSHRAGSLRNNVCHPYAYTTDRKSLAGEAVLHQGLSRAAGEGLCGTADARPVCQSAR